MMQKATMRQSVWHICFLQDSTENKSEKIKTNKKNTVRLFLFRRHGTQKANLIVI